MGREWRYEGQAECWLRVWMASGSAVTRAGPTSDRSLTPQHNTLTSTWHHCLTTRHHRPHNDQGLMATDQSSSSLLSGLGSVKGHKATLTTLLARDDLDAATSDTPVELPSARPLSHESFAGDEFDASEFLLERRHTGLDELRTEVSE